MKERDLEAMRSDGFWESPDRTAVLARIEYVDRVQAAFRTAENLVRRLPEEGRNGKGGAREVVALLAERLYLLDRACAGLDAGDPPDAFVEIRAGSGDGADEPAALLRGMYEAWGRRRGMRVARLPSDAGAHRLAVSGIGAYRILAGEGGLHVFESASGGERATERLAVQVAVAPLAAVPAGRGPRGAGAARAPRGAGVDDDRPPLPRERVAARPRQRARLAHGADRPRARGRVRRLHTVKKSSHSSCCDWKTEIAATAPSATSNRRPASTSSVFSPRAAVPRWTATTRSPFVNSPRSSAR